MRTAVRDTQLADDHILFFPVAADYGAETPTFQLLVVKGEALVFKVFFSLDGILQRWLLWNEFLSGLWSRSLNHNRMFRRWTPGGQQRRAARDSRSWRLRAH